MSVAKFSLVARVAAVPANIAKEAQESFAFQTRLVLPVVKVGVAKQEAAPKKKGVVCPAMNTFGMVATKTTKPKQIEIFP